MNGNTKVKVERTQLIDALRKRKAGIEEHAKKEAATFQERKAKAGTAAARELRKIADNLEKGIWPRKSYVEVGAAPGIGGADTASLDRAIKMLSLSAEPTIVITAEDYGKYL